MSMLNLLNRYLSHPAWQQVRSLEAYIQSYGEDVYKHKSFSIADLEQHHCCFLSSLHRNAHASEPDVSAFFYAALRLPDCVSRVRLVLLGLTEQDFADAGFFDVEQWSRVESKARRRRAYFDGEHTLAIFVTSISDLDDLVPSLCAFQIEWNKMHRLLVRSPIAAGLTKGGIRLTDAAREIRACLRLSRDDWNLLLQLWDHAWDRKIADLARSPMDIKIERLPLDVSYFEDAADQWWDKVDRCLDLKTCQDRPVYIVSSNTHSLANLISGYAAAHEQEILAFLEDNNPEDLWTTWQGLKHDPDQDTNNLLYYALRLFLEHNPDAASAKIQWEEAAGINRFAPTEYPHIEVQKIDLKYFDPARLDHRLTIPDNLSGNQSIIINMDYPLGMAAKHLLSRGCRRFSRLRGVFILGKSAAAIGRLGDIMIPSQVYDSHTGNRYNFTNSLSLRMVVPFLNRIAAFDDQKSITVRGTFLHGRNTVHHLIKDDFTGMEMEAGPYLDALYQYFSGQTTPRNKQLQMVLPAGFSLGLLHYTSDTPYNIRPSLLSSRLGLTGLEAAYASSLAILQRIMCL